MEASQTKRRGSTRHDGIRHDGIRHVGIRHDGIRHDGIKPVITGIGKAEEHNTRIRSKNINDCDFLRGIPIFPSTMHQASTSVKVVTLFAPLNVDVKSRYFAAVNSPNR